MPSRQLQTDGRPAAACLGARPFLPVPCRLEELLSSFGRALSLNIAARLISAGAGILCIPLYLHFLGLEAYGLVGVYSTLMVLGLALEGLTPTVTRQLARLSGTASAGLQRDFVVTLALPVWGLALSTGLAVALAANFIATGWVTADALPAETVRHAILAMAGILALQWPVGFYCGALTGLERQEAVADITIAAALIRTVVTVLVLWLVSPAIEAFFACQALASLVNVAGAALWLQRVLPKDAAPRRFRPEFLRDCWRFAAAMTGILLLARVSGQLDKVMLSRFVGLEEFGFYMLGWSIANGLGALSQPCQILWFPRLVKLVQVRDEKALAKAYHQGVQAIAVLVLPIAVTLALFAPEALTLWTRQPDIAAKAAPVLALLVSAVALEAMTYISNSLQMAYGWTRLTLSAQLVYCAVMIPAAALLAEQWGALGVAGGLLGLNATLLVTTQILMHRRFLTGELGAWWTGDVLPPLVAAVAAALLWRFAVPQPSTGMAGAAHLAAAGLLALIAAALATPFGRGVLAMAGTMLGATLTRRSRRIEEA